MVGNIMEILEKESIRVEMSIEIEELDELELMAKALGEERARAEFRETDWSELLQRARGGGLRDVEPTPEDNQELIRLAGGEGNLYSFLLSRYEWAYRLMVGRMLTNPQGV